MNNTLHTIFNVTIYILCSLVYLSVHNLMGAVSWMMWLGGCTKVQSKIMR